MQIGPDEPSAPPAGEEAADGDQEPRGREHCSAECSTEVCLGFGNSLPNITHPVEIEHLSETEAGHMELLVRSIRVSHMRCTFHLASVPLFHCTWCLTFVPRVSKGDWQGGAQESVKSRDQGDRRAGEADCKAARGRRKSCRRAPCHCRCEHLLLWTPTPVPHARLRISFSLLGHFPAGGKESCQKRWL
jgi:hypothetical protein